MEDRKVRRGVVTAEPAPNPVAEAIKNVANTADGKVLFKFLADTSFMWRSTLRSDQLGKLSVEDSINNEVRRRVYLDIRQHIPKQILKQIEY